MSDQDPVRQFIHNISNKLMIAKGQATMALRKGIPAADMKDLEERLMKIDKHLQDITDMTSQFREDYIKMNDEL